MADNFNLSKFIRNNPLLNESIGGYRDIEHMEEINYELEKPELIYNEDWMNDSIDRKRVGNWTCYYEDPLHVLYWIHDKILSEDLIVYATPNWDHAKGIAIEVQLNYGEHGTDYDTVGEPSYPDFESYAQDVAPVLKKVEDKYFAGGYNEYLDSGNNIEEAENINELEDEEWKWNATDQQGNPYKTLYVKPMEDKLIVTADDGFPGTVYTKKDIQDAIKNGSETIWFRRLYLTLDTRMRDWAQTN